MGYAITINKVIAGCSLVLSLLYLLGCCWEFGSIMYRNDSNSSNSENESEASQELDIFNGTNTTSTTTDGIEFWAKFSKLTNRFKILIIICLWGSIIALLLQSISSAVILFSSRGKTASRSKYWVGFLFTSFVILLITFTVPCTHSRDKDEFLSVQEFNSKIKHEFLEIPQGILNFMWTDLHLYYVMILFDLCFLFIAMIVVSCLLRFHEQHEEAFYAEISNRYK